MSFAPIVIGRDLAKGYSTKNIEVYCQIIMEVYYNISIIIYNERNVEK